MLDLQNGRVAVYLDFDNIVLSWYDRVHGRNSFSRDRQRIAEGDRDPEIVARLDAAIVNVGAIIDYASSFGTLVLTRAYADWSAPMNAEYRSQLVARAVDLVQLFPAAAYAKNGADIRLAVDAVEDMFRLEDLTHVVIVAGDSDYVPLAQRCKRLGRYVVGVGVAGSTAKSLAAACDEFATYDALPGVAPLRQGPAATGQGSERGRGGSRRASSRGESGAAAGSQSADASRGQEPTKPDGAATGDEAEKPPQGAQSGAQSAKGAAAEKSAKTARSEKSTQPQQGNDEQEPGRGSRGKGANRGRGDSAHDDLEGGVGVAAGANLDDLDDTVDSLDSESPEELDIAVTGLLIRALWLSQDRDDSGWLYSSAVKQQMRRMDPSFNEKALGFRSFSDFLKSRSDVVELEESGHERLVRLAEQSD